MYQSSAAENHSDSLISYAPLMLAMPPSYLALAHRERYKAARRVLRVSIIWIAQLRHGFGSEIDRLVSTWMGLQSQPIEVYYGARMLREEMVEQCQAAQNDEILALEVSFDCFWPANGP